MKVLNTFLYGTSVVVMLPLYIFVGWFAHISGYKYYDNTIAGVIHIVNKARVRDELLSLLFFGVMTWIMLFIVVHMALVHVFAFMRIV
jgi:hypothetical protein